MAINYPGSLDTAVGHGPVPSSARTTTATNDTTYDHGQAHDDLSAGVVALETVVGTPGSAVTTTHDYKIVQNANAITALQAAAPVSRWESKTDFFEGIGNLFSLTSGSNAVAASAALAPTTPSVNGVVSIATGTTSGGVCSLSAATSGQAMNALMLYAGTGSAYLMWKVMLPVLSNSTDTYTLYVGFADQARTSGPANRVAFTYTHGTNAGNWTITIKNATATATADSTVAVVANTWYTLEILCDGTNANYSINGTAVGTFSMTNADFPASVAMGYQFCIGKAAGTTSVVAYADKHRLYLTYST